jgi:queuine tRNA-ribosyltransferase
LRIESLNRALPYAKHGIAIGGIAIGEPLEELTRILECLAPHLPEHIPHYLMGAGTPDYILEAIMRGVDMFDCVYQTRVARNGLAMTEHGAMNIKNKQFRDDFRPIEEGCTCYACRNYSRAYVRHLITAKEMFGARLLSIHNIHFTLNFMKRIRESIAADNFLEFRRQFYKSYYKKDV